MNTLPVPSIGKIIFCRSTVRGTPHIMNPGWMIADEEYVLDKTI